MGCFMDIEEVKLHMKKHGITYQQLSDMSKINLGTLKKIFCGQVQNPRIDTMQAIFDALGIKEYRMQCGKNGSVKVRQR